MLSEQEIINNIENSQFTELQQLPYITSDILVAAVKFMENGASGILSTELDNGLYSDVLIDHLIYHSGLYAVMNIPMQSLSADAAKRIIENHNIRVWWWPTSWLRDKDFIYVIIDIEASWQNFLVSRTSHKITMDMVRYGFNRWSNVPIHHEFFSDSEIYELVTELNGIRISLSPCIST